MIAVVLLACRREPSSTDDAPAPTTADTGTPGDTFREPPIAEDLDPDPSVVHVRLRAAPLAYEVDGTTIEGFAFEGSVPGPTIEAELGQVLVADIVNDLPHPTTVHWHGLHVPAAMDGAGMPMPTIEPGGTFTATFELTQAGTFWYHPHLDTAHQVDLGLYGAVVVRDPAEPAVDRELVLVLDAFGEEAAAEHDPHLVDPTSSRWAVNGVVAPRLSLPAGTRVRARLINASNAGMVALRDQRVIAHDQGLLPTVVVGDLLLAPGDRAEVEWDVGDPFDVIRLPWAVAGGEAWGEPSPLLTVETDGGTAPPALAWPTREESPTPDPGRTDLRFLLSGSPELGWEMNGETFPDVTMPLVGLGEEVVIEVRNVSPADHPFHLHGHAFEVLSVDGEPPASRTIEDTVDVPVRSVVRLLLLADNPGFWMTHCHVLPHAEGGMMTMIEVR
ncbi:MAG: multicopper oxidase family protein [Alphaproteobacteria bacterium]|nr:multicopper oxidase family protein [Alphaproteobacteria bacterium]